MTTDFMKRQQHHLDKQKQFIEKSLQHYSDIPAFPDMKKGKNLKMDLEDAELWSSRDPMAIDPSLENSPYNSGNEFIKRANKNGRLRSLGTSAAQYVDTAGSFSDMAPTRSRTMPPLSANNEEGSGGKKNPRKLSNLGVNLERLQLAKDTADRAIKARKIFTIQGPYPAMRRALRNRGWVEKFYKIEPQNKKSPRVKKKKLGSDDDDDDQDDGDNDDDDDDGYDENTPKPWEEDNGLYGIMSRMVKNCSPNFIWCLRRDNLDFRYLRKDQMVNHYSKNGAFTTKVGLCTNLRNAHWFEDVSHETFYPRCYRLSHEEEKQMFTDDYCLTACMSVIRWVIARHREGLSREVHSDGEDEESQTEAAEDAEKSPRRRKRKPAPRLPMSLLDVSIKQCERLLEFYSHDDLETADMHEILTLNWDVFISQYYDLCQNGGIIPGTRCRLMECELLTNRMREIWPQFDLDGIRNIWIVKPGAQSRGRGIMCYDKLQDMLKLVDSVVRKDSKFVVQKYMERPLLVHGTKFDIRQWFLVTDWNPLTIWWYNKSYLRFCKRPFSLTDFHEAIHLSNNAIQKNYPIDPNRSSEVPQSNMWTCSQFKEFLSSGGEEGTWDEVVIPAMKKSIICALLTTVDIIEYRKSSFELYGADFMLTEDLQPWLIEINSSPSMCTSTDVTAELCPAVLDDTVKVVIDRKFDKGAYTGDFELLCKMPSVTVPQYLGINLQVDGTQIKPPGSQRTTVKKPSNSYVPESQVTQSKTHNTSSGNSINKREKESNKEEVESTTSKDGADAASKDSTDGNKDGSGKDSNKKAVLKFSHAPGATAQQAKLRQEKQERHEREVNNRESISNRKGPKRIVNKSYDTMTTFDPLNRRKQGGCLLTSFRPTQNEAAQARDCPLCGNNGFRLIGDASHSYCTCRQDCIKFNMDPHSTDQIPFQIRNGGGIGGVSLAGNFNSAARSKVLCAMRSEDRSSLIVPLSPRKLILKPPADFGGPTSSVTTTLPPHAISKFYQSHAATFGSMPGPGGFGEGRSYRKPKKTKAIRTMRPAVLSEKKAMFILAESFINPPENIHLNGKF